MSVTFYSAGLLSARAGTELGVAPMLSLKLIVDVRSIFLLYLRSLINLFSVKRRFDHGENSRAVALYQEQRASGPN